MASRRKGLSILERNQKVIGAISLALILGGTAFALLLQGGLLTPSYKVTAYFTEAAGIVEGDPVTVAGLPAGTVKELRIERGLVAMDLGIEDDVKLSSDSRAEIVIETLLGRRSVSVVIGQSREPLQDGDVIPVDRTTTPIDITELNDISVRLLNESDADAFEGFLEDVAEITEGQSKHVSSLITGLNKVLAAVDSRRLQLSRLIESLRTLSVTFGERDQQIVSLIDDLDVVLGNLAERQEDLETLLLSTDSASHETADLVTRNRAVLGGASLVLTACALVGGSEEQTYRAVFSRAIQLFPGGKVRVLGVDVGVVEQVENEPHGVVVTFRVEEPDMQLPADVEAAIVPASLLGERYVQLFPAYQGGPTLPPGATIPASRTAVPSEPDELLRSLQDYLGAIDPAAVNKFVTNAAAVLRGNGAELNDLIHHAAGVIGTLAAKRDDLARIVVEFDKLTRALLTRKEEVARLIHTYNEVVGTLTSNRAALEGSITGLNEMAVELASLLIAHRGALNQDVDSLTRTGRTLQRNVHTFAHTGHWASRLFHAAARAVDFDKDWLRLTNQGQELPGLIVQRLKERLVEVCQDLNLSICSTPSYWSTNVPALFCFKAKCPTEEAKKGQPPEQQLTEAIQQVPSLTDSLLQQFQDISCAGAKDKAACLKKKKILIDCAKSAHPKQCIKEHAAQISCLKADNVQACIEEKRQSEVKKIVDGLLDETLGSPKSLGVGDLP